MQRTTHQEVPSLNRPIYATIPTPNAQATSQKRDRKVCKEPEDPKSAVRLYLLEMSEKLHLNNMAARTTSDRQLVPDTGQYTDHSDDFLSASWSVSMGILREPFSAEDDAWLQSSG